MAEDFDPYYQWLGISPKYQPPTYYRLLGLETFESNPDVIATAADQRMAHVRSFQGGKRATLSQRILNELSAARGCLLNVDKKLAYDQALRERLLAERAEGRTQPPPPIPGDSAASGAATEPWTKDLADNVKAASRFTARQTERLKIEQFSLPTAYEDLGDQIYRAAQHRDEFVNEFQRIVEAEQEVQAGREQPADSAGQGLAGKMINAAAKVKDLAKNDAASRKRSTRLRELGEAAYSRLGEQGGPAELTGRIASLRRRLAQLDTEIAALSKVQGGQPFTPRRIALAAVAVAVLFVALLITGSLRISILILILLAGAAGYWQWQRAKRQAEPDVDSSLS